MIREAENTDFSTDIIGFEDIAVDLSYKKCYWVHRKRIKNKFLFNFLAARIGVNRRRLSGFSPRLIPDFIDILSNTISLDSGILADIIPIFSRWVSAFLQIAGFPLG